MAIQRFIGKKAGNLAYEKSVQGWGFHAFERLKVLIIKHLPANYLIIKQLWLFCNVIHSLSETCVKKVVNKLVFVQTMFIISPCVVNIPCRYSDTSVPTLEQAIQNRFVFWQREFGETKVCLMFFSVRWTR